MRVTATGHDDMYATVRAIERGELPAAEFDRLRSTEIHSVTPGGPRGAAEMTPRQWADAYLPNSLLHCRPGVGRMGGFGDDIRRLRIIPPIQYRI